MPGTKQGQAATEYESIERMGRIARNDILYDGCYAYVFSRAFEKRKIFKTINDFKYFKDLMLKTKKKYEYQIHHYRIIHTYFHMVVTIGDVKVFCSFTGS